LETPAATTAIGVTATETRWWMTLLMVSDRLTRSYKRALFAEIIMVYIHLPITLASGGNRIGGVDGRLAITVPFQMQTPIVGACTFMRARCP